MSNFHDFLTWFDGWAENIEKQPTEKQWGRLRAKLAEVRSMEPVPAAVPAVPHAWPAAPVQVQAVQPTAPKAPSNEREWAAHFKAHLVEESGMDPDSAGDVFDDYKRKREKINLSLSPTMEAATAAAGMMN